MYSNEFIKKVRELVLNNAELNKTVMDFVREHPECWSSSNYDTWTKLVGLRIEINFHTDEAHIKEVRPWFSIDFGYSNTELNHSEILHEKHNTPGVYKCYIIGGVKAITTDKVNW